MASYFPSDAGLQVVQQLQPAVLQRKHDGDLLHRLCHDFLQSPRSQPDQRRQVSTVNYIDDANSKSVPSSMLVPMRLCFDLPFRCKHNTILPGVSSLLFNM